MKEINGQFVLSDANSTSPFDNLYKIAPREIKKFNEVLNNFFKSLDQETELKNKVESLQQRLDLLDKKIDQIDNASMENDRESKKSQ